MIKKIIFGLATVAALASCNGDYDDWASPQANPQKDAAEKFVMTVQPAVSSIDFETEAAESIQLFSTNLAEGQTEAFNVTLTGCRQRHVCCHSSHTAGLCGRRRPSGSCGCHIRQSPGGARI